MDIKATIILESVIMTIKKMIFSRKRFPDFTRDKSLSTRLKYKNVQRQIGCIEGWLVPGQEIWLFSAADKLRNGACIVEIGSYKGRSTASLAFACVGTNKHVFAIDRWHGVYEDIQGQIEIQHKFKVDFFDEWCENMRINKLQDYVTPLVGNSTDIARIWRAPIDMLFVDGSHRYEDVVADFENFSPYMRSNGLLVFHDVTPEWAGSYRAWHEHIAPKLTKLGSTSTIAFGYKQ
jgi:predicted O-methyltransferase YrrM